MGDFTEKYAQLTSLEGDPILILPSAVLAIVTYRRREEDEGSKVLQVLIRTISFFFQVQETLDEVLERIGATVMGAEA